MSKKAKRINVSNIVQSESENGLATNKLTFTLTGSHVENVFSNTIIRTMISLVGAYGYEEQDIEIVEDTIHNPDYMARRVSNIPIAYKDYMYDPIENFAETCVQLEQDYYNQSEQTLTDIELIEFKNKKKIKQMNNIHMSVNAKNNTKDIIAVTSNEKYTTFYKNGEVISDFYPREILILYMQPEHEIVLTAESSFNIPMYNNSFSSVSVAAHKYIDEHSYSVTLESLRQMPERQIVIEACKIIILKLENIKNKIHEILRAKKLVPNIEYKEIIQIPGENQTLGEIFAKRMCKHKSANYVTFRIEHPDDSFIILDYDVAGMTMSKITEFVVNELKEDYGTVMDAFIN